MHKRVSGFALGLMLAGTGYLGGWGQPASAQLSVDPCSLTPTITATAGVVKGTSHADVILIPVNIAATVYGNAGDDAICSESVQAVVYGGAGNDRIDGFGELHGGANSDTITFFDSQIQGRLRTANVYGEAGDDLINVDGASFVDGGSGNDDITANDSGPTHGGSGNDVVRASDQGSVFGDSGDDDISVLGVDAVDCGSGRDSYSEDGTATLIRRCEIQQLPV